MGIGVDMVYSPRVKGACPTDEAMHLVAFGEEELGQIRPVLSRNAGDQCAFHVYLLRDRVAPFYDRGALTFICFLQHKLRPYWT